MGPPRIVNIEYSSQDSDLVYAGVNHFDPRVHLPDTCILRSKNLSYICRDLRILSQAKDEFYNSHIGYGVGTAYNTEKSKRTGSRCTRTFVHDRLR